MSDLFSCALGEKRFRKIVEYLKREKLLEAIEKGTLVGLSGGADSVFLLLFLLEYRKRNAFFPIEAIHVHHGIRGAEADRDLAFSESLCVSLGVPFHAVRCDVPALAKTAKSGIEEAAREARYSAFYELIRGREDLLCVATAHNATDNLETVLFHLARGAGGNGLSGIPPITDRNVVRPILCLSSAEIRTALDDAGIAYMCDSTNDSDEFHRNYIRHEIIPRMSNLYGNPEEAVLRLSASLRADEGYLLSEAEGFLSDFNGKQIPREALSNLPEAVFSRVFKLLCSPFGFVPEENRMRAVRQKLSQSGDFSVSLPCGVSFRCERGVCTVSKEVENRGFSFRLNEKETEISDFRVAVLRSSSKEDVFSSNVYKFAIQADLSSAIIEGDLFVRSRRPGDSYFYGGMTHSVSRLMIDKKIPNSKKDSVPVFCDARGVVWIPGFGVRDDGGREKQYITLGVVDPDGVADPQGTFRGVFWHNGRNNGKA